MTKSPITLRGVLSALVIAATMAAFSAQPATAQTAKKLKCNGCVKTKQVKNNSLQAKDLRDEAGANFADGDQDESIAQSQTETVRSVTIDAPRPGVVIVNATATLLGVNLNVSSRCSITTGNTVEGTHEVQAEVDASGSGDNDDYDPFALTRGFEVPSGSTTFNLVCRSELGTSRIRDSAMTAIYVPTRYD